MKRAPHKPFPGIKDKFSTLRAARIIQDGGLIAHATFMIPGAAVSPFNGRAVRGMQQFKQRSGPFLLIADSVHTACRQMRYIPSGLRRAMRASWPGNVTFIVSGRPGLPDACYEKGRLAVRVDADASCRRLAALNGGLIISSSLNRGGRTVQKPCRQLRMRWHRYIRGVISADLSAGTPSRLMLWQAGHLRPLR